MLCMNTIYLMYEGHHSGGHGHNNVMTNEANVVVKIIIIYCLKLIIMLWDSNTLKIITLCVIRQE